MKIADDGEILMGGPNIFKGYYGNPEATKETLSADGWLHSGDLGELDADGYLSITGRKKDLIITSSGKNISPSNIENALKLSRWISQAIVYGDRKPVPHRAADDRSRRGGALAEKVGAELEGPGRAGPTTPRCARSCRRRSTSPTGSSPASSRSRSSRSSSATSRRSTTSSRRR